jgi:hypothetical protein
MACWRSSLIKAIQSYNNTYVFSVLHFDLHWTFLESFTACININNKQKKNCLNLNLKVSVAVGRGGRGSSVSVVVRSGW